MGLSRVLTSCLSFPKLSLGVAAAGGFCGPVGRLAVYLGLQVLVTIQATTSWLPDPGYQILALRSWLPDSGV